MKKRKKKAMKKKTRRFNPNNQAGHARVKNVPLCKHRRQDAEATAKVTDVLRRKGLSEKLSSKPLSLAFRGLLERSEVPLQETPRQHPFPGSAK